MNVAILISGQMRTADLCVDSIRRHIYGPAKSVGEVRFFVHCDDDEDAHKNRLFNPHVTVIEKQPTLPEKNYAQYLALGCYGVQVVLRQLWSLQRSWKLMEESGYVADWVIRLRPDCYFHNAMENLGECDPGSLYIPTFHNFYGYNDRFAFGQRYEMRAYCNRIDTLDEYILAGGPFQPECHLKWVIQPLANMRRTRVLFDLVRKGGKHVKPEWNKDADYGDVTEVLP